MTTGTKTPASQPTSLSATTVDTANGLEKIKKIRIRLEDALKGKQDVIQQVRQRVVEALGPAAILGKTPTGSRDRAEAAARKLIPLSINTKGR